MNAEGENIGHGLKKFGRILSFSLLLFTAPGKVRGIWKVLDKYLLSEQRRAEAED